MKKIFFVTFIICAFTVLKAFTSNNAYSTKIEISLTSDFCNGWEDGYCEGWRDLKGQNTICPITPICPLQELGQNSYRGGYNRGFKEGSRTAQK
jgi:hypothetical protein